MGTAIVRAFNSIKANGIGGMANNPIVLLILLRVNVLRFWQKTLNQSALQGTTSLPLTGLSPAT